MQVTRKAAVLTAPRVGAIAIVFRENQVILVQRGKEPRRGQWGFPGGAVEPGESLREAALRELLEETGVHAESLGMVDVVEVREFDGGGRHHHYVLIAMLCRYLSGNLTPGDDAADCRWVDVPDGLGRFSGVVVDQVAELAEKALRQLAAFR